MANKKGIKYNSKSTIILNKYTPEEKIGRAHV